MSRIKDALHYAFIALHSHLEAQILLSLVLQKDKTYLFAYPEASLTDSQWQTYHGLVNQRQQGMPIAYITGTKAFWSLDLAVTQDTLIPRPETELLVELVLQQLPNDPHLTLLDLGTGSGAVALAIAKERPQWQIDACDISPAALHIAQNNANVLGINNITFYRSDWFSQLPPTRYHAIVANPPYIAAADPHLHQGDLRFEPKLALISGQEGLTDLHYIVAKSMHFLQPNGLLLVEHGYDQKYSISTILKKLRYQNVHCWQDFQGHDRVSGGFRPNC